LRELDALQLIRIEHSILLTDGVLQCRNLGTHGNISLFARGQDRFGQEDGAGGYCHDHQQQRTQYHEKKNTPSALSGFAPWQQINDRQGAHRHQFSLIASAQASNNCGASARHCASSTRGWGLIIDGGDNSLTGRPQDSEIAAASPGNDARPPTMEILTSSWHAVEIRKSWTARLISCANFVARLLSGCGCGTEPESTSPDMGSVS
jgi:hypothetical protein